MLTPRRSEQLASLRKSEKWETSGGFVSTVSPPTRRRGADRLQSRSSGAAAILPPSTPTSGQLELLAAADDGAIMG